VNNEPTPWLAPRAQSPAARRRGLALTGAALVLLSMFGTELTSMNLAAWRSIHDSGPASPDQALAAIAGLLALGLTAWLLCALALSLLAALVPDRSVLGQAITSGARIVAPVILRNAVAALLGVAVVAAPAAAQATSAPPAPIPVATSRPVPPPVSPDRQLSPAWGSTTSTSTSTSKRAADAAAGLAASSPPSPSPAAVPDPSLLPGWLPSRPTGPSPQARPRAQDHQPVAGPGAQAGHRVEQPQAKSHQTAPLARPGLRGHAGIQDEIVVRRADTLWDIAARHLGAGATNGEIAAEWPHWFTANRSVIGHDPDHLVPGERLRAPEPDHSEARGAATNWSARRAGAESRGGR